MSISDLGESHGKVSRQPLTLRLDFYLHVIPYFVYIAHFKNSLVEVLCLWKNLCSRKNQERKKVLGKKKKKKKKKEKTGPKKKKEYHSVEKRKISFVKETCNDEAPRWRPYFEQRSRRPTKICHTLIQNTSSTEADFYKNIPIDDIDKHQNKTY